MIKMPISYTGGTNRCKVCLEEKYCIFKGKNKKKLLNKNQKLSRHAANHKRKFLSKTVHSSLCILLDQGLIFFHSQSL